ncbi:MAG: type II toxin-antitoxin system VapC family toxin [Spirulinaceae cyanobacterium]
MSLYVFDTDCLTLFQPQHPSIVQRVTATNPQDIAVTIISLEEQIYGRLNAIRRANSPEKLVSAYSKLKYTWGFFTTINLLDFSPESQVCYAELIRQKIRIGTQDLRIAAIALSVAGIVITRNQRDFGKVPGLIWEDWTV